MSVTPNNVAAFVGLEFPGGNDDDVAFNTKKKYSFAMALFDDSMDADSYDSEAMTLEFGR